MTTPDKVSLVGAKDEAVSSVQAVSRKLLARRRAAKERNSKVRAHGLSLGGQDALAPCFVRTSDPPASSRWEPCEASR